MTLIPTLSDYDHPTVKQVASGLVAVGSTRLERLEQIFYFVRDEIRFGFPPKWDAVKASETLEYRVGYCTTKATLFLALSRAVGIPARLHTGLIQLEILWGILPSFAFLFLPEIGDHTWVEVEIEGKWLPLDSYINDLVFYQGAVKKLQKSDRTTGFSISKAKEPSSPDFNFGEKGFVHMGAVVADHGTWDDFSDYMNAGKYTGMRPIELRFYPLMRAIGNRNVTRIRKNKK